jgi:hypothetical protein
MILLACMSEITNNKSANNEGDIEETILEELFNQYMKQRLAKRGGHSIIN